MDETNRINPDDIVYPVMLQRDRIYRSKGGVVKGICVIKFLGAENVVYDYYNTIDCLLNGGKSSELVNPIGKFKEYYDPTPFLYDTGEV